MHKPDREEGRYAQVGCIALANARASAKDQITLNLKRLPLNPEKTNLSAVFGIKALDFRSFKYQLGMLADAITYH